MSQTKTVFEKELPRGRFIVFNKKPEFEFISVKQTHSSIVLPEINCIGLEADAMIGSSSTPLAILTADCLPVLILGEKKHAFVHAGWKGLHNEILKNNLIREIKPFYAFIGPHISADVYEVQPDFKNNFKDQDAFREKNGKLFFDLSKIAKKQLESTYVGIKIEESGICTLQDERFHSYRRNNTNERNWNIYIP